MGLQMPVSKIRRSPFSGFKPISDSLEETRQRLRSVASVPAVRHLHHPLHSVSLNSKSGGSVMLQAMASGGNLGSSLFRQVNATETVPYMTPRCYPRKLKHLSGHRSFSLSPAAIQLRRFCPFTVLLRLCTSCRLLSWVTAEYRQRLCLPMPCGQRYCNT